MSYLPAHGSTSRYYVALPSSLAVVRLEDTPALTGQAVHRQEARLAQTLSFLRPEVDHTARKLIARLELAGICLISCGERERERENTHITNISILEECVCTSSSPRSSPREVLLILMRSSASGLQQNVRFSLWRGRLLRLNETKLACLEGFRHEVDSPACGQYASVSHTYISVYGWSKDSAGVNA